MPVTEAFLDQFYYRMGGNNSLVISPDQARHYAQVYGAYAVTAGNRTFLPDENLQEADLSFDRHWSPSDERYAAYINAYTSKTAEENALVRKRRAIWNGVLGLAAAGGDTNAITVSLAQTSAQVNAALSDAYNARLIRYLEEGKVCRLSTKVVLCYNTYDALSPFFGAARTVIYPSRITNHCPSACGTVTGYCDTDTGTRYSDIETAERSNCRPATDKDKSSR